MRSIETDTFTFLCIECDKPLAVTGDGEMNHICDLFLMKDGIIIESMYGEYDGAGSVMSGSWGYPFGWGVGDINFLRLILDDSKLNGIAAFHSDCLRGTSSLARSSELVEGSADPWDDRNKRLHQSPFHMKSEDFKEEA